MPDLQAQIAELQRKIEELTKVQAPIPAPSMTDIAAAVGKAVVEEGEKLKAHEVPFHKFPGISAFNPLGDLEHPRPKLLGKYSFMGDVQDPDVLTKVEIDLWNAITPGTYPPPASYVEQGGSREPWYVVNVKPGTDERDLLVKFPVIDDDQRRFLPSLANVLRHFIACSAEKAKTRETAVA